MGKGSANKIEPAKSPSTWTDHALERFIDRWWPLDHLPKQGESTVPVVRAIRERTSLLAAIVRTRATFVELIPGDDISIWAFYMTEGPYQGHTGLMVVDRSGVVRTVLPPATRKP